MTGRHRRNPPRQHPERDEQAAIVKLLKLLGASVYVIGTVRRKGDYQGTNQTPGIPDLYAVLPIPAHRSHAGLHSHVALWVEVKSADGRPTEAQTRFYEESEKAGMYHVIGGITKVTDWLRAGGWIK